MRHSRGALLRDPSPNPACLHLPDCHRLWWAIPGHFNFTSENATGPYYPTSAHGFPCEFSLDSSLFARRYLRESQLVSLPLPTWMFPFGRFPLPRRERREYPPRQEVPLGYLRIEGCMRLPGAYRCLPRPSSAPKPSHPSGDVSCQA